MSLNYTQSLSNTTVSNMLLANTSITAGMYNAISNIINLSNQTLINVGNTVNGTTLTSPAGVIPSLVICDIPGAITDPIVSITNTVILNETSAVVFNTNCSVSAIFGSGSSFGINRVVVGGTGNDVLSFVDFGSTTVDGCAGNDSITTSTGADSITGGTGNDTISAGAGNDTIVSGSGYDTVDGGSGFDIVQVAGTTSYWTTAVVGGKAILFSDDNLNQVTTTNVNFVSFTDATGSQTTEIFVGNKPDGDAMRLYQALLDRSPDAAGAQYWLTQVAGGEGTFKLANAFMATPEYIADYGTQSNTQFVNQIYDNAFNRAPDEAGLAYWVTVLNNGASRATTAVAIVGCPEAEASITNVIYVPGLVA